jgi:hypothetical protein
MQYNARFITKEKTRLNPFFTLGRKPCFTYRIGEDKTVESLLELNADDKEKLCLAARALSVPVRGLQCRT